MSWRDILEITATVLTIAVSMTALLGAFIGHKSGFFKAIHHISKHHYESSLKEKAETEQE